MQRTGFRRRFPWNTALLFGSVPAFAFLIFFAWFRWELPPLQAYYLASYWECSRHPSSSGSVTEIQWLYKSAPRRMSVPLVSQDVDRKGWGLVPISLSSSAQADGWTELVKLPRQSWPSSDLQEFFERDFYDGRTAKQIMAQPLSVTSLIPVLFLVGVLYLRRNIAEEWRELYTGPFGDEPIVDVYALRQRLITWFLRWRTTPISSSKPEPSAGTLRETATANVASTSDSERPRASSSDLRMTRAASATHSAKPLRRSIFPGASSNSTANEPWDESQWIE